LSDDDHKEAKSLIEVHQAKLRDGLIAILEGHLWPDDLDRIYDTIEDAATYMYPVLSKLVAKQWFAIWRC
jgi:hypothetical protein